MKFKVESFQAEFWLVGTMLHSWVLLQWKSLSKNFWAAVDLTLSIIEQKKKMDGLLELTCNEI